MPKLEIIKTTPRPSGVEITMRWTEPPLFIPEIIDGCPLCGEDHEPVVVCGLIRIYPCPRVPEGVLVNVGEFAKTVAGDMGLGGAIARNVAAAYCPHEEE